MGGGVGSDLSGNMKYIADHYVEWDAFDSGLAIAEEQAKVPQNSCFAAEGTQIFISCTWDIPFLEPKKRTPLYCSLAAQI